MQHLTSWQSVLGKVVVHFLADISHLFKVGGWGAELNGSLNEEIVSCCACVPPVSCDEMQEHMSKNATDVFTECSYFSECHRQDICLGMAHAKDSLSLQLILATY